LKRESVLGNLCTTVKPRLMSVVIRETREGWPLLIVETEANGDLWRTNEGGPLVLRLVVPVQEIFVLS
jgi:hypothetical protein